ncbi:unnamed protein product [Eruca vesicaria subsp. sativa]|uniref:Uncharacterized protein n=1 Tax=Eruca vesicaria subsp. sativa TaxID=29727 RepID=A0ABC8JGM5_ERUVS|nr:unnamed protein product [Eruca vesicaria subsp. sativa]
MHLQHFNCIFPFVEQAVKTEREIKFRRSGEEDAEEYWDLQVYDCLSSSRSVSLVPVKPHALTPSKRFGPM